MNKKALVTLVMAGSIVASPVFASGIFQQLLSGKLSEQSRAVHQKKLSVKPHKTAYTDFSGNWSGHCVINTEESVPMSFAIENDDNYFSVNDQTFAIGSLETQSESGKDNSDFSHSTVRWNTDMSKLIINFVSVDQDHDSWPYNHPNPMNTFLSEFTVGLENGQLIIKGQGLNFTDLHQKKKGLNLACTMDKKS